MSKEKQIGDKVYVMREAIIKKNKNYKFGQRLIKGEKVFIKEEGAGRGHIVYMAFRPDNDTVGFGVTPSEFEYVENSKFIVNVTRTSYSSKNIEVQAKTRKEAEAMAIEEAGNLVFSEQDAEYKANAIFTEQEHKNLFK